MGGAEEQTCGTEVQLQQIPCREERQLVQVLLKAARRLQSLGGVGVAYVINTCADKAREEVQPCKDD